MTGLRAVCGGWLGLALCAVGCGFTPATATYGTSGRGDGADDGFPSDEPVPPGAAATSTGADDGESATFGDEGSDLDDECVFVTPPDLSACGDTWHCSGAVFRCSPWAQDCCDGDKCMPWGAAGGSWDSFRCSTIADTPVPIGGDCVVEGGVTSGVDNCDIGSVCFFADVETGEGECVAQCVGTKEEPVCDDGFVCSITNADALTLCLAECNPLADDCGDGRVCVPGDFGFGCAGALDVPGQAGDECSWLNDCGPGLGCVDGVAAGCLVDQCCTPYCDLSDDDPDAACDDPATGATCWPLYPSSDEPAYADLGVCLETPR